MFGKDSFLHRIPSKNKYFLLCGAEDTVIEQFCLLQERTEMRSRREDCVHTCGIE